MEIKLSPEQVVAVQTLADAAGQSIDEYFTARCLEVADSYVAQSRQLTDKAAIDKLAKLSDADRAEVFVLLDAKIPTRLVDAEVSDVKSLKQA